MNAPSNPREEVTELCDRMLDGSDFGEVEKLRLEALVIGHPEARRQYIEYMQIHAALGETSFGGGTLAEVVNMPLSGAGRPPGRRHGASRRLGPWLAAAAAVGILAAGWGMGRWQREDVPGRTVAPPVLASLVEVKGARWDGGSLPTQVGASLPQGRLRLAAGLATLEFSKGARLTLEAPADLELLTADRCFLHSGAIVAHIPPQAVGFVVETAHARLVDHGTDFGISAGADGEAQVQVFKGEVELQHHQSGEKVQLLTRQAANVTGAALVRSTRTDMESERPFARQSKLDRADVINITTATGRGQAGYAWSPSTKTHFSDTLLLLKYTKAEACRRKAWLGFDLASLEGRKVKSASLTLTFEPTGYGYASLLPDCEFSVYGITDDNLDGWDESGLVWENAPANDLEGPGVDLQKAVKLGSFIISQGETDGAYQVHGPELAEFLSQDRNRFATLVVVRDTPEVVGGGLVHGFAGNHHPTLKPPALRIVAE